MIPCGTVTEAQGLRDSPNGTAKLPVVIHRDPSFIIQPTRIQILGFVRSSSCKFIGDERIGEVSASFGNPFKFLYGTVGNYMIEKIVIQCDLYLANEVKLHLSLTGHHFPKSFMDL
jgi:hypothetical protein